MNTTTTETTYRVERGINDRAGQFVVIKVQRGMYRKPVPPSWGDVAWVSREAQSWWPDQEAAAVEQRRLSSVTLPSVLGTIEITAVSVFINDADRSEAIPRYAILRDDKQVVAA